MLAKHRFMKQRFRGSYQPDELDHFLLDLAASVQRMEKLLRDPRACRFVPVMLAEEVVMSETLTLLGELESADPGQGDPGQPALSGQFLSGVRRGAATAAADPARAFQPPALAGMPCGACPCTPEEMRGAVLAAFWDGVRGGPAPPAPGSPAELPPRVEAAPPCPSADTTYLDLRRQGGRGQDHPGLRHRTAPGPGLSGQGNLSLLHRPGPLPGRLPGGARRPQTGAPGPGPDRHGDRRPRGIRRLKEDSTSKSWRDSWKPCSSISTCPLTAR